jgi:pimeloyl-ACP methyl ester carboxylesterase
MTTQFCGLHQFAAAGVLAALLACPERVTAQAARSGPIAAQGSDGFVTVRGIRLHYVDWGGTGPALLFLTGLGDSAHAFDALATNFTDRFHVRGLTRRGQGQSDKPPSGYDPRSLAEDIRAFLDVLRIDRVTLVGFSAAGSEQTRFAGLYPDRVDRLVYLDAAEDYKSGRELATNPRTKYPLPLPEFDGPLGAIVRGAEEADPDYTKIAAPALAFFTIYAAPYIPDAADEALRARLAKRWQDYGNPFQRQKIEHFRRDMKNGEVIEVRDTDHGDFLRDQNFQRYLVREMRRFLLGEQGAGR